MSVTKAWTVEFTLPRNEKQSHVFINATYQSVLSWVILNSQFWPMKLKIKKQDCVKDKYGWRAVDDGINGAAPAIN